ncbi:hypothetical protein QCE73_33070 [Caballeronia sp. LZ029]|uniref:hypothetical protein n=1 Tax=Caballeronia sp. LZ029 TaxID=3038564 RepID=UPI00285E7C75|nr:hypothetical protein [Caballeronia sp. LZ029]MDR5748025.1 hypothetical protein [Caballeronia sp. LZ029]
MTVTYAINGEPVEQRIALLETACTYGGTRAWFECPHCRRRAALLYLSRQVACRQCFSLAYPSQSEDAFGRMRRKQLKIEVRLASGPRITDATRARLEEN